MKFAIYLCMVVITTFVSRFIFSERKKLVSYAALMLWILIGLLFLPFLFHEKSFLITGFFNADWAFPMNIGTAQDTVWNPEPHDSSTLYFPHKLLWAKTVLTEHVFPFWDPYRFVGYPASAGGLGGYYNPLNFIFLIFSAENAWNYLGMLEFFLAGIFMYLLILKLTRRHWVALWAAVSFMLMPLLVGWSRALVWNGTALWLPLILLSLEYLIRRISAKWIVVLSFAVAMCALGGWILYFFYIILSSAIYFLFRFLLLGKKNIRWQTIGVVGAAVGCGLAYGSFQIFPSLELGTLSPRPIYPWEEVLRLRKTHFDLGPTFLFHWLTLIFPDLLGNHYFTNLTFTPRLELEKYLGCTTIVLALFGLCYRPKWRRIVPTLAVLFISLSIYRLGIAYWFLYHYMPGFDRIIHQQNRIIFIFGFFLLVLASFGLSDLYYRNIVFLKLKKAILLIFGFGILILTLLFTHKNVATAISLYVDSSKGDAMSLALRHPSIYISLGTTLVGLLSIYWLITKNRSQRWKKLLILGLLILQTADLAWNFKKTISFSKVDNFSLQGPLSIQEAKASKMRVFRLGGRAAVFAVQPNLPAVHFGIRDTTGWDSFFTKNYAEYSHLLALSKDFSDLGPQQYRTPATINLSNFNLIRLLNVDYIFADSLFKQTSLEPFAQYIHQQDNRFIYRLRDPLPEIFSIPKCEYLEHSKIIERLADTAFKPEQLAFLEKTSQLDPCSGENFIRPSKLEMISRNVNEKLIHVVTEKKSLVFISETYYPGWEATVDGKSIEMHNANLLFQAVVVPPGDHSVKLSYRPKTLRLSLILSLIASCLLALLIWRFRKPKLL